MSAALTLKEVAYGITRASTKRKLVKLYTSASDTQRMNGLFWYKQAWSVAVDLANKYNKPLYVTAGIVAALSPNNKWERNIKDADSFLAAPSLDTKVCTFMSNRVKALKILQAKSTAEVEGILKGRKTVSFFNSMVDPWDNQVVTVDLWMYRGAELKATAKNYEIISDVVKEIASEGFEIPMDVQAIIWTVLRQGER